MQVSRVLKIPLKDKDHTKVWVRCPCCLDDYPLDEGRYKTVEVLGREKRIKFCNDCVDTYPISHLGIRAGIAIHVYDLKETVGEEQ